MVPCIRSMIRFVMESPSPLPFHWDQSPAVKFFKDPFHRGVIHADAGIADGDAHLISCDDEFGRKHTASRGEFDGIFAGD